MATAGTFFELDRRTADWAAGDLAYDGEEIDEEVGRTAFEGPWVTAIALAIERPGETSFAALDLAVSASPSPAVLWLGEGWQGGRAVPVDAPLQPGPADQVRGVLVADDASPTGLRLTNATIEPAGAVSPPLPCDPPLQGPFHPDLLLEQRCARRDLDGAEAVVVASGERWW